MGHCLLCCTNSTEPLSNREESTWNASKLQESISKCNKYLSKDMHPNINWNLQLDGNPFCKECEENTQQLVQLDLKLEQVNTEIKQLTFRIKEKIQNERQNFHLINVHNVQASKSVLQTAVGQSPAKDQPQETTKSVEGTFDNWNMLSSSNDSHASLQDDTLPGQEQNFGLNVTEEESTGLRTTKKLKSSTKRKLKNGKSNRGGASQGMVTSSDFQLQSDNGGYACPKCNKKFTRIDILKRHDCEQQTYECEVCGKSFSSPGSLNTHNLIHTGEKPHKCDTCGKSFSLPHHLRLHLATHSEEKLYGCDICKKNFREKSYLVKHKRQHSTDENERRQYTCEICSKSFSLYSTLKRHMRTVHLIGTLYTCSFCGKACETNHALRMHEAIHSGEKKFKCSHCWKTFVGEKNLRSHELTHEVEKFQCDVCGSSYRTQARLNFHIKLKHVDESDFTCDICGKLYKTQLDFKIHRRYHAKYAAKGGDIPNSFKCVVCDRSYSRKYALETHQRTMHSVSTGINMVCEVCETVYQDHVEFRNHLKVFPTKTRNFRMQCLICNLRFRTRCDMICHFTKNHTESEFPFKCLCKKAFLGRKELHRHIRNECTVKRVYGKMKKKKPKNSGRIRPDSNSESNYSETDEKVYPESKPHSSGRNLRRSGRSTNKKGCIDKEDPDDSEDYSFGENCGDSDYEEPAVDVEIKTENDIWIKEEVEIFSD